MGMCNVNCVHCTKSVFNVNRAVYNHNCSLTVIFLFHRIFGPTVDVIFYLTESWLLVVYIPVANPPATTLAMLLQQ